ncbi:MAG: hypothetical protein HY518_03895 [Candidatus Aenigmarchaeota archaeon]|nr:hypothetical protein [Candidatus Aenigmarchaeota archaeon]
MKSVVLLAIMALLVGTLALAGTSRATSYATLCSVRITQFDVTNSVEEDTPVTVTFTVFNFGNTDARVGVTLILDGRIIGSKDQTVASGASFKDKFVFTEDDPGDRFLELKVEAFAFGCSSSDFERTRLLIEPATTGCAIEIKDFDLDRDLDRENNFFLFAEIRNTGRVNEDVRMDLLIESKLVQTQRFELKRNQDFIFTREVSFSDAGTFRVRLRVSASTEDCIAEDFSSELARVSASDLAGTAPPATQPPATPPGTPTPAVTGAACSIAINRFDFPNNIAANRPATATAEVSNTGSVSESIQMVLTVDGRIASTASGIVEPGRLLTKGMQFTVPPGQHRLLLTANSVAGGCINSDTIAVDVSAADIVRSAGQPPSFETPSASTELDVDFPLTAVDIEVGTGKAIPIEIAARPERPFKIEVSGVPADWVDFDEEVEVSGRETHYVFVTPKEAGEHSLQIRVEGGGKTFTSQVSVFAAQPSGAAPVTGKLTDTLKEIYSEIRGLFSDPKVALLALIGVAVIILAIAAARLRQEKA